jgi:NitT/TauT family transport system substrate-binding protein
MSRSFKFQIAALALIATACAPTPVQQSTTPKLATPTPAPGLTRVSIADLGVITQAPVYIAMDRGYFEAVGLEANLVPVRAVSETAELAATGQVDFGGMAPDPALFNALERSIKIKLLGSGGIFHQSLTGASGIVVRQDLVDSGRYREWADLKGFKIAVGSVTGQFYVERILKRAGLTEKDVEFTTLALQDMPAGLNGRAVDAAWMVEPLIGAMRKQNLGTQVASGFDAMQSGVAWLVFASPSATGNNPEIATRFMRAYVHGLRDFHHAFGLRDASPDPVLDALAAHSAIHDRKVLENAAMHPVEPNGALDIGSLDRFQDYYMAHGAQNQKIDLTRHVDTAPLDAALATLGRL